MDAVREITTSLGENKTQLRSGCKVSGCGSARPATSGTKSKSAGLRCYRSAVTKKLTRIMFTHTRYTHATHTHTCTRFVRKEQCQEMGVKPLLEILYKGFCGRDTEEEEKQVGSVFQVRSDYVIST